METTQGSGFYERGETAAHATGVTLSVGKPPILSTLPLPVHSTDAAHRCFVIALVIPRQIGKAWEAWEGICAPQKYYPAIRRIPTETSYFRLIAR